jgi:hypothetical protein
MCNEATHREVECRFAPRRCSDVIAHPERATTAPPSEPAGVGVLCVVDDIAARDSSHFLVEGQSDWL